MILNNDKTTNDKLNVIIDTNWFICIIHIYVYARNI